MLPNTKHANEMQAKWRRENKDKVRASSEKDYRTIRGRARNLFHTCKSRAKKKSIDFNLSKTWIENRLEIGICELTGIPFSMERDNPFTPSVDRIDTLKGYTEDNCRLICWALNAAFNKWGEESFHRIAFNYLIKNKPLLANSDAIVIS